MDSGEKLCLACGLCCDGTLFGHVRLGLHDDVQKMRAHGLPVTSSRGPTPVTIFPQPCTALCADRTCRLYADRPVQCRTFECGVFKDALGGRITFAAARRRVKQARRQADRIRLLLRELGDTEEHRPLADRFRRMQRRMESGSADAVAGNVFGELGLAMHQFNLLAHEKFYTKV